MATSPARLPRCLLTLPLLLGAATFGCADKDDTTNDLGTATATSGDTGEDTGTSGDTGEGDPEIAWGACPTGFTSECAKVAVPVNWEDPASREIEVFISRKPAAVQPATRQVWLLQGGPGGSGDVFVDIVNQLAAAMPDLDVFVLEHRGVGESTRLECPDQEAANSELGHSISGAEMPGCIAALQQIWGPDLDHMNTTNAAKDLQYVVNRMSEQGQQPFVYGVSYGVWWALRYLQIDPDTAAGVILDSLPSPGAQWLSDYDKQFDPVFTDIAGLCAQDAVCGQKLGDDPWARIRATATSLGEGHCEELGIDTATLQQLGAILLMIDPLRKHLAPLFYRLERCDPADAEVVLNYFLTLLDLLGDDPNAVRPRSSIPLQFHIALSEIWEIPPPPLAELAEICESKVLCPFTGVSLGTYYDQWPRYPVDPLAGQWPQTGLPVLSMNGELDPQTPYQTAAVVDQHLTAPQQTYVQVPYAPHGIAFASPVMTPGAPVCGMQMILGFLADPWAPIQTGCLSDLVPLDFEDTSGLAGLLFGTDDVWENPDDDGGRVGRHLTPPDWSQVIDALRRAPIRL